MASRPFHPFPQHRNGTVEDGRCGWCACCVSVDLQSSQRRARSRCDDSVGGCGEAVGGQGWSLSGELPGREACLVPYGPGQEGGYAGNVPHAYDSVAAREIGIAVW